MTARQVWEGMLTELSKVNAPSMLLQDFNYFFNKAINQYINKRYNIYDISQQSTDDLRVLKATSVLDVNKSEGKAPFNVLSNLGAGKSKLLGATYEVDLPPDYLHILNCVCIYRVNKNWKCYNAGDYVQFSAKRLTADSWSVIVNDYYNRPLPERPYFYIHNVNLNEELPTNPLDKNKNPNGTDLKGDYNVEPSTNTVHYHKMQGGMSIPYYVKGTTVYEDEECTRPAEGVTLGQLTAQFLSTPNENNTSNYARIKEFFNIANLASGGVRSWSAYIRYDDIRNTLKNQNNLDVIGQAAYQRSWQDGYWYAQVYEYPSYRPFINYKD